MHMRKWQTKLPGAVNSGLREEEEDSAAAVGSFQYGFNDIPPQRQMVWGRKSVTKWDHKRYSAATCFITLMMVFELAF